MHFKRIRQFNDLKGLDQQISHQYIIHPEINLYV